MGSDENHFNVPLTVRNKITRQCPQTTTSEERGEPKRNWTDVIQLLSLNVLPLGQTGSHPALLSRIDNFYRCQEYGAFWLVSGVWRIWNSVARIFTDICHKDEKQVCREVSDPVKNITIAGHCLILSANLGCMHNVENHVLILWLKCTVWRFFNLFVGIFRGTTDAVRSASREDKQIRPQRTWSCQPLAVCTTHNVVEEEYAIIREVFGTPAEHTLHTETVSSTISQLVESSQSLNEVANSWTVLKSYFWGHKYHHNH